MTETNSPDNQDSADSSAESSALVEADPFEEIIDAIPEDGKREVVRHKLEEIRETFVAAIIQGTGKQSPEVVKIMADTIAKDNDNKFQFLSQQQKYDAEESQRSHSLKEKGHEFQCEQFRAGMTIIRPIIFTTLFLVVLCIGIGVYLVANGNPTLGASLITGCITSILAFAAGFGTGVSGIMKGLASGPPK